VQPDRLALHLRRRRPWEAIDLGCRMAQTWWAPVMAAWVAAYVPAAVILYAAFRERAAIAVGILWWLKPVFDRVALEVLARGVFGEVPRPLDALRALRDSPGVLAALTIHRFDLARSFNLPVSHLEKLRGKAARERARALGRRNRGAAVWTTIVFAHFEIVALLALFGLTDFFTPAEQDLAFGLETIFWNANAPLWHQVVAAAFQVLAVSLLEPFYVASGFALYLNRRTHLEAWDVELTLRGIAHAHERSPRRRALAAAILAVALCAAAAPQRSIAAIPEPQQAIREILADPAFRQYREEMHWSWHRDTDSRNEPARRSGGIGALFAEIARVLMWIGVGALAVLLAVYARRHIAAWMPESAPRDAPPQVLFGLDIAPESLPRDLAAAALAAIESGQTREALGLMYRGALSDLVTRHALDVGPGDTEGDCVRRTREVTDPEKARIFAALVVAWQTTAYAQRPPQVPALRELWHAWRAHFAGAPR
jgi:hypothetical protein